MEFGLVRNGILECSRAAPTAAAEGRRCPPRSDQPQLVCHLLEHSPGRDASRSAFKRPPGRRTASPALLTVRPRMSSRIGWKAPQRPLSSAIRLRSSTPAPSPAYAVRARRRHMPGFRADFPYRGAPEGKPLPQVRGFRRCHMGCAVKPNGAQSGRDRRSTATSAFSTRRTSAGRCGRAGHDEETAGVRPSCWGTHVFLSAERTPVRGQHSPSPYLLPRGIGDYSRRGKPCSHQRSVVERPSIAALGTNGSRDAEFDEAPCELTANSSRPTSPDVGQTAAVTLARLPAASDRNWSG